MTALSAQMFGQRCPLALTMADRAAKAQYTFCAAVRFYAAIQQTPNFLA